MRLVSVSWSGPADELRAVVEHPVRELVHGSPSVAVRLTRAGQTAVCTVDLTPAPAGPALVHIRQALAGPLARLVVDRVEPHLLARMVARHYSFLPRADREALVSLAAQHVEQAGPACRRPARIQRVQHALTAYLTTEDRLHLHGFVRFRLAGYLEDLEDAVDRAVDDFLLEREYREFLQLLRYFLDSQPVRVPVAHVLLVGPGRFALVDEAGHPLPQAGATGWWLPAPHTKEDWLLTALLEIAPGQVVLHGCTAHLDGDGLHTLRRVFGERLRTCPGCELCRDRRPGRQKTRT